MSVSMAKAYGQVHSNSIRAVIVRELRNFLRQSGLAPYKIPAYIKLVSDDALPKTASRKYIRKGLAEVLGVVASTGNPAPSASSPAAAATRPSRSSGAT